jgi:NitT/TauT family transport system substrate-binding protein
VGDLLWPAFAKATGIDASRVRTVGVDFRGYEASFVAGQTEATNSALGYHGNVTLARRGRPVGEFVYSDHLPMPGFGIVVSLRTLAERPAMIQQFVRATQTAWKYLLRSPGEAVAEGARIIGRHVEGAPDEGTLVEASLRIIPQLMRSRSTEGRPAGWSNPEDWQGMMAVLRQHDNLPRVPAASELMTNRFVE